MYLGNTVRPADLHILDCAVLQHFINGLGAYAESRARFLHAHYFGIALQYRLIYFFEIHLLSPFVGIMVLIAVMFSFRFHNHVDSVIDALHRIVARLADVFDQARFIQGSYLLRKHDGVVRQLVASYDNVCRKISALIKLARDCHSNYGSARLVEAVRLNDEHRANAALLRADNGIEINSVDLTSFYLLIHIARQIVKPSATLFLNIHLVRGNRGTYEDDC